MWNMPYGAARVHPLSGKNKVYVFLARTSISLNVLSQAREGTGLRKKRKGINDQKRMVMHVPKWKTSCSS